MSRLNKNELLSGICKGLQNIGVKAKLIEKNSSEAIGEGRIRWLSAVYDINEAPVYVGSIKVKGDEISQIQLFSRIIPSDVSAFRWYDIHFCVIKDVKGKRKDFAVTVEEGKGFLRLFSSSKKNEKLKWVGGNISERLNEDWQLTRMLVEFGLWRFHGDLHPTSSVRICPDEKYGCVRIVFRINREASRDPRQIMFRTVESWKIAERITKHVMSVKD